jgi:hypothetical protein
MSLLDCFSGYHQIYMKEEDKASTVAEPPELFQRKCPSLALEATTHLNRNDPSVPRI